MERLRTLIGNFREQLESGAPASRLMLTLQMLQSELMHMQQTEETKSFTPVHVDIPVVAPVQETKPQSRVVEILNVDERALEAELEEIRQKTLERTRITAQTHQPVVAAEETDGVPAPVMEPSTRTEVHELLAAETPVSLNDRFVNDSAEVAQSIAEPVIKDLRKGIGVNDRYVFINELFKGDDGLYEKSIKTINSFKIYAEAEFWIRQELKSRLGWVQDNPLVRQFDQLIRRRFASI